MSDFVVRVKRSRRHRVRQRFYVVVQAAGNRENLLTSEMLAHPAYALELGQELAQRLDANLVDETEPY